MRYRVCELTVAIGLSDFRGMVPPCFPLDIAVDAAGIRDIEPLRERDDHHRWHLGGVGKKGAQKAHRAKLQSESKAGVVRPEPGDLCKVSVAEMEVPIELLLTRNSVEAAVTTFLFSGQEPNGHSILAISRRQPRSNLSEQACL